MAPGPPPTSQPLAGTKAAHGGAQVFGLFTKMHGSGRVAMPESMRCLDVEADIVDAIR